MLARSLFLTPEQRLRAPWRILAFFVACLATYAVLGTLVGGLARAVSGFAAPLVLFSWVATLSLLVATYVTLRWVDGESWGFVRLGRASARPSLLTSGALMGLLAIGVPSLVLVATRDLRVVPALAGNWFAAAWHAAILLLPAALTEELLLRGYIFAVLRETIGWKWTLIGTSVVFGLLHMNNPGATPESIIIVIVAGFFLGTIVIVTESLYAAWMAHFAWNWTMAGALHTAVSGLGLNTPGYRVVDNGPDWLTGGSWGPEGGAAAALGMFVFLFYMFGRNITRLKGLERNNV